MAFTDPPRATAPGSLRHARPVWRPWLLGWLGCAALAVINGITRELLLRKWLSKMPAHFLSTAALIGVMTPYFWQLDKRWPLPTTRRAAEVGAAWLNLTVLFEFGLGRFEGQSWSQLLEQYDIRRGNVWVLVLVWVATGPAVVHRFRTRR